MIKGSRNEINLDHQAFLSDTSQENCDEILMTLHRRVGNEAI